MLGLVSYFSDYDECWPPQQLWLSSWSLDFIRGKYTTQFSSGFFLHTDLLLNPTELCEMHHKDRRARTRQSRLCLITRVVLDSSQGERLVYIIYFKG